MQDQKLVMALSPRVAAGVATDWICMANYRKVQFVFQIDQNNAATTAITCDKAKTSAGGDNVDGITMQNWWSMIDVAGTTQAAASDLMTKGTAAASITSSATGTGASIYVVEFDAEELGDGYDFVQMELGASNAANIISVLAILSEPRYAGASNPTALA